MWSRLHNVLLTPEVAFGHPGPQQLLEVGGISHPVRGAGAEIENYVHRIGRTGRCGKTGIATTFINKDQSESILLDLKHLLTEAKQRIPPVLTVRSYPCMRPSLCCGNVDCMTNLMFIQLACVRAPHLRCRHASVHA